MASPTAYRHADNVAAMRLNLTKHEAAVKLGSVTSEKKAEAAAVNGAKGGRPAGS